MRIFVAGATGALGIHLVPRLVAAGHEVTGMTRTPSKRDALRAQGARPVVADALDPDAVARAVAEAEPEVIVHQLTALSGRLDMRHLERMMAATNRLRTEGTDNLLAAGRAVGRPARRGPELRRLAVRPDRRSGQDRGRPARRQPARRAAGHARRDPPPGARRDRDRLGRGTGAALRRLLRPGHRPERRPGGADVPGGRASARCRWSGPAAASGRSSTSRTRRPPRPRRSSAARPASTRWSTTSPAPVRVWLPELAPRAARRAAAADPALGRPPRRRRGRDGHDDRDAGRLERQGEAGARLGAALRELARRLRRGARMTVDDGSTPSCGRPPSRWPTACSAA